MTRPICNHREPWGTPCTAQVFTLKADRSAPTEKFFSKPGSLGAQWGRGKGSIISVNHPRIYSDKCYYHHFFSPEEEEKEARRCRLKKQIEREEGRNA